MQYVAYQRPRMMRCRLLALLLSLFLSSMMLRNASASHEGVIPDSVGTVLAASVVLLAIGPAPYNVYRAATHNGSMGLGILGIATGALSGTLGLAMIKGSNDPTWGAIALTGGAINIGAGIWSIAARPRVTVQFAPMTDLRGHLAPGLQLTGRF